MPAVQAALKQEQASNLAGVTRRSVAAMTDALSTLREITRNAEAPWAARVSAARAILECGLRFTEALDLAERVAALEEKRGEIEGDNVDD
ncbi:MAG: hypothetical protein HY783_02400, partial [Chloroflexi bacterium]|nr:hypothetical protein [Chloroflexota bacterium]